ncbi:hypothetical protein KCP78_15105 [Salmonella enterica subsp. enterica]|nr:hypothetical protein KCP78_15105 [Salmonella enterica subsp. enterica]
MTELTLYLSRLPVICQPEAGCDEHRRRDDDRWGGIVLIQIAAHRRRMSGGYPYTSPATCVNHIRARILSFGTRNTLSPAPPLCGARPRSIAGAPSPPRYTLFNTPVIRCRYRAAGGVEQEVTASICVLDTPPWRTENISSR